MRMKKNTPLPVEFVHNDEYLLLGSPRGKVSLVTVDSDNVGHRKFHSLPHPGMFSFAGA